MTRDRDRVVALCPRGGSDQPETTADALLPLFCRLRPCALQCLCYDWETKETRLAASETFPSSCPSQWLPMIILTRFRHFEDRTDLAVRAEPSQMSPEIWVEPLCL